MTSKSVYGFIGGSLKDLRDNSEGKEQLVGVDHCLKFVVAVDEDVNLYNESEVLWAISTRFQADRDLVAVYGAMGVILDPSASENGLTARMGIDATKPLDEKAVRCRIPSEARDFAKSLIAARSRKAISNLRPDTT